MPCAWLLISMQQCDCTGAPQVVMYQFFKRKGMYMCDPPLYPKYIIKDSSLTRGRHYPEILRRKYFNTVSLQAYTGTLAQL